MAKKSTFGGKVSAVKTVETIAQKIADQMSLELVEVTLQKESRGKCLCVYVDKEGGLSLDDCEHYHKALQPLLEEVDYDIMEVSSPGVDRPIKTARDFEKHCGDQVEVKLFAPLNGSKLYTGALIAMDDNQVVITDAAANEITFERKSVAVVKPIVDLDADQFAPIELDVEE